MNTLEAGLTNFGRDTPSSDSFGTRRNFGCFCQVSNALFCGRPNFTKFGHKTSIGVQMKTFGTEFWNFHFRPSYVRNDYRSPEITTKLNWPSMGCLLSIFTVRIHS